MLRYIIIVFFVVAIPMIGWRAIATNSTLDSIRGQDSATLAQISSVQAEEQAISAAEALQRRRNQTAIGVADASAPMTEIQGKFSAYLDRLAQHEGVGIGGSTCDAAPTPQIHPSLDAIQCSIRMTGTYAQLLDATRRVASDAPVVVEVTGVTLERNDKSDGSSRPTLAATVKLALERVSSSGDVAQTLPPTAVPSPSPAPSASPASGA